MPASSADYFPGRILRSASRTRKKCSCRGLTLADCLTSCLATSRAHQIAPFRAESRNHSPLVTFGQGPWTRLPPVLFPLSSELQSRSAPSTRIPLEFIHGYVSTRFSPRNSSRAQDRQARGRHRLRVHRAGDFAVDKHRPLISGQDSAERVSRHLIDSASRFEAGARTDQAETRGEGETASACARF